MEEINTLLNSATYAKLKPNATNNTPNPFDEGTIENAYNLIFPPKPLDFSKNCLIIRNVLNKSIKTLTLSNSGNANGFFFVFKTATYEPPNPKATFAPFQFNYSSSRQFDPQSQIKIWRLSKNDILLNIIQFWDPIDHRTEYKIVLDPPLQNQEAIIIDFRSLKMVWVTDNKCEVSNFYNFPYPKSKYPCNAHWGANIFYKCDLCGANGCCDIKLFKEEDIILNKCYTNNSNFIDNFLNNDKCKYSNDIDDYLNLSPFYINVNLTVNNITLVKDGSSDDPSSDDPSSDDSSSDDLPSKNPKPEIKNQTIIRYIILTAVLLGIYFIIYIIT